MKHHTTLKIEARAFFDAFHVTRLSEIRTYQWNEALFHLTREPP